jgi:hypothetical protein
LVDSKTLYPYLQKKTVQALLPILEAVVQAGKPQTRLAFDIAERGLRLLLPKVIGKLSDASALVPTM